MLTFLFIIGVIIALSFRQSSLKVWTGVAALGILAYIFFSSGALFDILCALILFSILAILLNVLPLRRRVITTPIFKLYRRLQPSMSQTERDALEAGDVDWDGDLFSGKPDWNKLLDYPRPELTEEEQDFIDGPVEVLCSMIDDWEITHKLADLPVSMWDFLKKEGFFGLIIPKSFGGKGFSALAHAAVLTKVAGKSATVSSTITVPNSLGPAELLLNYGTEEQKKHYLPRLASGQDIPCFALTGPEAGSDASSLTDRGIVCKDVFEGKEVLGIRLNWDKRYITLAPVATVLGLAFKLYDPDGFIGDEKELGITCALIPTDLDGIKIGRRHFPLNIVFQNGPTQGKDVFIPLDFIIGGIENAGQGWRMLMECLSEGRSISLPCSALGGAKAGLAATSAYARIRKQFGLPIGRFEGVQAPLARIAGYTYIMDAACRFTAGLVNKGIKPSVLSAIVKYQVTEMGRIVANDVMDIHGGKGICLGPKNYVARGYQAVPISITVEGANILTRSLMIFGQGVVRAHPYMFEEMEAGSMKDFQEGLVRFDKALFSHIGWLGSNKARAFCLGLTGGRFLPAPNKATKRYYQQFSRFSAGFTFVSDLCLLNLGAKLKCKEALSGRLADILSDLYLGSCVLKQFDEQGSPEADLSLVHWACQTLLCRIQHSFQGVLHNLPDRFMAFSGRMVVFPLGRRLKPPKDSLAHEIVDLLLAPTETRDRLLRGAYLTPEVNNRVGELEEVLRMVIEAEPLEKRIAEAVKSNEIKGLFFDEQLASAFSSGLISQVEANQLRKVEEARIKVIAVDDFDSAELSQ